MYCIRVVLSFQSQTRMLVIDCSRLPGQFRKMISSIQLDARLIRVDFKYSPTWLVCNASNWNTFRFPNAEVMVEAFNARCSLNLRQPIAEFNR